MQAASSTSGAFLRARALNKVERLVANAGPKVEKAASKAKASAHLHLSNIRDKQQDGWETPPGVLVTPKGGHASKKRSVQGGDFLDPAASSHVQAQAQGGGGGGWLGGISSYFSAGAREERDKSFYTEERIVCFPGHATLRPSMHSASEPALILDVFAHGYAYRLRPVEQASRSQKVFYSLAKSFAALPKVPAHLAHPVQPGTTASGTATPAMTLPADAIAGGPSVDSLSSQLKDAQLAEAAGGNVFEQLLEIGGREGGGHEEAELAHKIVQVAGEEGDSSVAKPPPIRVETAGLLDGMSGVAHGPGSHTVHNLAAPTHAGQRPLSPFQTEEPELMSPEEEEMARPVLERPATLSRRARVVPAHVEAEQRKANNLPVPVHNPLTPLSPSHRPGSSRRHKTATDAAGNVTPPLTSPTSSGRFRFSRPSSLHSANNSASSSPAQSPPVSRTASRATSPERGQRTPPRPERHNTHEFYPKPFGYTEEDLPRMHANLQARLLPFFGQKLGNRRVRLSVYPALENGTLWDKPLGTKVVSTSSGGAFKTTIEVRSKELRRLLDDRGMQVDALDKIDLRVVAELLEPDALGDLAGARFAGTQGLKPTCEEAAVIPVAYDGGVRVISDIDDTVKWTEVLGGTKAIFRNVFVRELWEIRVPGMAHWYQQMKGLGAHFHYVSNSPWELWPVIRQYLQESGFPAGGVTLKEYGGASSALAKLWEEPGQRKRAGVENILKEFPHSKFILVGDSGEQDMNLYVALAAEYPQQVLAIYIRDVTTPFKAELHPDRTMRKYPTRHQSLYVPNHANSAPTPTADRKPFSEMPDLPGQFDGSHEAAMYSAEPEAFVTVTPPSGSATSSAASSRPTTADGSKPAPPAIPARPPHLKRWSRSNIKHPNKRASLPPIDTNLASRAQDSSNLLVDDGADALSPNNPLRPEPSPTVETAKAAEKAIVDAFYHRITELEKGLPRHIPLRIFRHGRECELEGVKICRGEPVAVPHGGH